MSWQAELKQIRKEISSAKWSRDLTKLANLLGYKDLTVSGNKGVREVKEL